MDREVLLWIVEHRTAWLNPIFAVLSAAGIFGLLWIGLSPFVARLGGRPILRVELITALLVVSVDLVAYGLRLAIGRPRPFVTIPEADPLGGGLAGVSLPSGHMSTSFAALVFLTFVAPKTGSRSFHPRHGRRLFARIQGRALPHRRAGRDRSRSRVGPRGNTAHERSAPPRRRHTPLDSLSAAALSGESRNTARLVLMLHIVSESRIQVSSGTPATPYSLR